MEHGEEGRHDWLAIMIREVGEGGGEVLKGA